MDLVHLLQSSQVLRGTLNEQQYFEIFSKPCCRQISCHLHFVVPLQSTGSVYLAEFLTVLRFSKWQMRTDFSFKSAAALAPNKRVRQSFEALKRSTDFFSLTVKALNSIFLQYKDVLSSLKICCLVKTS